MEVQNEKLCFCKIDIVSICTAASESEQKKCKFYKKSSFSDKCMYLVFDEYCDCMEAQVATQQEIQKNQGDQEDFPWI